MIAGSCSDEKYYNEIEKLKTENIEIKREFISKENLNSLFSNSKSILFIYEEYSVLSSGALIDTLCANKLIIGPHISCFKELQSMNLVSTYKTYNDIFEIVKQAPADKSESIFRYYSKYSWQNFSQQLIYEFSKLNRNKSVIPEYYNSLSKIVIQK